VSRARFRSCHGEAEPEAGSVPASGVDVAARSATPEGGQDGNPAAARMATLQETAPVARGGRCCGVGILPAALWRRLPACFVAPDYGTVRDQALVSPDSKPSANGIALRVSNENTVEVPPSPHAFSDVTRQ